MVKPMKIPISFFIIISLFLTSCSSIPPEKQCKLDSDCVPSVCCHANDVVNKNYAPNCKDLFCTLDCQPGTLDCGQGQMKCLQKQCTAVISQE